MSHYDTEQILNKVLTGDVAFSAVHRSTESIINAVFDSPRAAIAVDLQVAADLDFGNYSLTNVKNLIVNGGISAAPYYGVSWNESTDAYSRTGALAGQDTGESPSAYMPVQEGMKRCVLDDSGNVLYFLDPTDSTKKDTGEDATIDDQSHGQVMVQIPKFWYRYSYASNTHTWDIAASPVEGFTVHPAFIKDGDEVDYRYVGAYEGSLYDDTASAMVGDADIETNMYAAGDVLCSISGEYPKTNETRAEFRAAASARGAGWRIMDYDLMSAVQLLYLVEYADFNSQDMIGNGRTMFTNGAWEAANQGNGKYIGACGYSNGDGNATNATDRAAELNISAIDTSQAAYQDYMTYRGIENLFGNTWNFIDGAVVYNNEIGAFSRLYVHNKETEYADDGDILGTEVLTETDFATHANWDVTGDLDDSGGNLAFSWTANQTSTATQASGDFNSAMSPSARYRLTYTVAVTTAFDGDGAATLTTGIAAEAVSLPLTAGTHIVEFTSASSPSDFVISIVSGTDTEGVFTIDDVSLKPLIYEAVGDLALSDDYQDTLIQTMRGFMPATVGASSSTKITDYFYTYYDNLSGGFSEDWRVLRLGGSAYDSARAGVFCVLAYYASSDDNVSVGARLCF